MLIWFLPAFLIFLMIGLPVFFGLLAAPEARAAGGGVDPAHGVARRRAGERVHERVDLLPGLEHAAVAR